MASLFLTTSFALLIALADLLGVFENRCIVCIVQPIGSLWHLDQQLDGGEPNVALRLERGRDNQVEATRTGYVWYSSLSSNNV
jgi:hypothetical protein